MSTSTINNSYNRPTASHSTQSLRQVAIKKNMSITQTYYLAHKARSKLSREAAQPDHDLRLLVGHANLLDSLMLELADAEREQERWFNQSVRGASNTKDRHVQWADNAIAEEDEQEYDSDSSDSDDYDSEDEDIEMTNAVSARPAKAVIPTIGHIDDMEEDDLEEDYAQLELVRTHSHSTSPPELVEHDFSDSSDDDSMPPSPPQPALADFDQKDAKKQSQQDGTIYQDDFYLPTRNPARLVSAITVY
ncbi:hypothetical protein B0J13DRAFT_536163 [Dactylonectria estremocensis]|uniref:Protein ECM13 n=1 Tax=Dactylonectria estremocensis TaxID=1079267 RepID=A0A9P9FIW2_9HYPO|nr:hypothetical protein B0J13DRAFT_536163 [Dactylonectria estremocensis]